MNAQQLRLVWIAISFSLIIYAVLVFMMLPVSSEPFGAKFSDPMILILHLAGAGMLLMSFVVPMLLLRTPGPASRARLAMIIRWALTETPAIFGLLAAFFAQDARLFLPLGVLSLAAMLLAYPSSQTSPGGDSTSSAAPSSS